jgi:hypothetical protein
MLSDRTPFGPEPAYDILGREQLCDFSAEFVVVAVAVIDGFGRVEKLADLVVLVARPEPGGGLRI